MGSGEGEGGGTGLSGPGALRSCHALSSLTWGSPGAPHTCLQFHLSSAWSLQPLPHLGVGMPVSGPASGMDLSCVTEVTCLWGGQWIPIVACLQPRLSPWLLGDFGAVVQPCLQPCIPLLLPGWMLDLARCLSWLGLLMG